LVRKKFLCYNVIIRTGGGKYAKRITGQLRFAGRGL
jgi:hypothetical protein